MQRSGRQLALVVAATAIGVAIFAFALDGTDDTGFLAQGAAATATPTAELTELPAPTPTPVAPTAVVLVANSTGIDGLAGATTAEIEAGLDHPTLTPVDSTGDVLDQTAVHAEASAMAEARRIADLLGLDPASVAPMPASPPVEDLGGAQILVIVGLDRVPQ